MDTPESILAVALGGVSYACRATPITRHQEICSEARAQALCGLMSARNTGLRNSAQPEVAQLFWRAVRRIVIRIDAGPTNEATVFDVHAIVRDSIFTAAGRSLSAPGYVRRFYDCKREVMVEHVMPSDPGPSGLQIFDLVDDDE